MLWLCLKCPERENCSELCPKAEKYASRDYKLQRERTYSPIPLRKGDEYSELQKLENKAFRKSTLSLTEMEVRFSGEMRFSSTKVQKILENATLTRLQRQIFLLHLNEVPRWQIARNLKINKRKVSNQLYTAKRKIKEFLSNNRGEKT
jgi:hypothetical protein